MDSRPKVSPITGKCVHFGHLQFNLNYIVTLENEVHDILAIRDIYGIKDWIKEKKELVSAIKKMNIEIYFRRITSPFIVKKEGFGTEFEFHQKGAMFVPINNEHEYLF